MSAFFVGIDHINAMLTFVEHLDSSVPMPDGTRVNRPNQAELTAIGRELIKENCNSLRARYPSDWKELLPDDWQGTDAYHFKPDLNWLVKPNAAVRVIKLCHCYDYQSCEHDGWEESFAYRFSHWLADRATSRLPGYDDADWGYYKETGITDVDLVRGFK